MRFRIQIFTLLRIQSLLFIKVIRICDRWSTDPPRLHFELLERLNFDFNAVGYRTGTSLFIEPINLLFFGINLWQIVERPIKRYGTGSQQKDFYGLDLPHDFVRL
jgi:hypothetical protein